MADRNERAWWRQAVVYQIYPRSFADASGDGVGDLAGITSRVDYLAALGVDAVWLSPFYPSALADGGYDVDDYRDVDPLLGTLADFDAMLAALHGAGIKLIVDIVPNHSSDRHRWFVEALTSPPGSPARDRYLFRDGRGPDGAEPPSDWQSQFGGPAWTRVPDGQWYLHLYAPEQPDLNWANPEVHADFLATLKFWADRGVDGFRIDVAHGLAKDLTEPLPPQVELASLPPGLNPLRDRDEVHQIYAEWRALLDTYDPPRATVAEAWVPPERRVRYASASSLGQAFNFDLLKAPFRATDFRTIVTDNLALAAQAESSSTWVLSNHDVVRHASRYGLPEEFTEGTQWLLHNGSDPVCDRELGLRRALAATMLILALPGSTYLYQGEELGLQEVADLAPEVLQDPVFLRSAGARKGRDGCRVPLPWKRNGSSFGFGDDGSHLPQPDWFGDWSVAAETGEPGSPLERYRTALAVRRKRQGAEELVWIPGDDPQVLHFARQGGWESVTNFGDGPIAMPPGRVLAASADLPDDGSLPAATTVWLDTSG
jgi:alpha-glucosidase